MRYLTQDEVVDLHGMVLEQAGGAPGIRDPGALDMAVVQPQMTFAGQELYPTLAQKASALAFSLVMNHPFVDGNKRIGHAAMDTFLFLNNHELSASVDEQEKVMLALAAGELEREPFTQWVQSHMVQRGRI